MLKNYFKSLENLNGFALNFSESGLFMMSIVIAFIMFGVSLGIKRKDFYEIAQNPKSVITGIISQFVLMPSATFLIVFFAELPVSVSLGMLLVAACPGGNISNLITSIAKGNVALSVSLTAFSDMASIIMTPLNFTFWGTMYISTLPLANPVEIPFFEVLKTILFLMGVPLFAGLWVANKYPKVAQKIFKPIKAVSFVFFAIFILGAIFANKELFLKYILLVLPIVIIHNFSAFLIGYISGKLTKLSIYDKKTIIIETGIQNSGIALILIFSNKIFPPGYGGAAFIVSVWGVWHMISGLALSSIMAKIENDDSEAKG